MFFSFLTNLQISNVLHAVYHTADYSHVNYAKKGESLLHLFPLTLQGSPTLAHSKYVQHIQMSRISQNSRADGVEPSACL